MGSGSCLNPMGIFIFCLSRQLIWLGSGLGSDQSSVSCDCNDSADSLSLQEATMCHPGTSVSQHGGLSHSSVLI